MKNKKKQLFDFYKKSLKIRYFENGLLDLFSKGKIKGTTHTCVGQENNAVGVCAALDKSDIVLSNHRCHGHFLAHTNNFEGLLNEILGKKNGVCGGIGGSQHLFYKKIFYSNGILGGNLPMSVGLAKGKKIKKDKNIICIFLGDGVFGEGILYECLNMISVFKLPILLVVEENGIAQTTNIKDTISGSIAKKCESFKIDVSELKYPDALGIHNETKRLVKQVKKNKPQILILKSTRLGPHSKGDDTRSRKELDKLHKLDPLKKLAKKIDKNLKNEIEKDSKKFITNLFERCLNNRADEIKKKIDNNHETLKQEKNYLVNFKGKRFGELINYYFLNLMKNDNKIIFLGEDIIDPYGGAFKITKKIKNTFPKQIFSTPISEASIVGMAGGLSVEGFKPVVEIMFGDFLGLAFDQIINNLSKFHYMYGKEISLPLVIRTPMGGGRGYGPTHSQSIEKHFFGITGLNIFALNPFFPINLIYEKAFSSKTPSLVLENKLQYNFILSDKKNSFIKNFNVKNFEKEFVSAFSLSNFENDEITLICYGGTTEMTLKAAYDFFMEKEVSCKVLVFSKLSEIEDDFLKSQISKTGPIFVVEESSKFFGFGSEIGSILNEDTELKKRKFKRLSSADTVIPASPLLEQEVLLSSKSIKNSIDKF